MKRLKKNIPGISSGFRTDTPKAWTKEEQKQALKIKGVINQEEQLRKPY